MLTLGVDLSADPKKTGACWIRWEQGRAEAFEAFLGVDDQTLVELIQRADKVGIDVPFGWPTEFVRAVTAHQEFQLWPGEPRARLRYRETDHHVHQKVGLPPMSVSSDLIGVVAMRGAGLLSDLAIRGVDVDRSGASGKVAEVYPAAALKTWGLAFRGYKNRRQWDPDRAKVRTQLLEELREKASWLELSDAVGLACRDSDDVFDALVASIIARATVAGLCEPVPPELVESARREGWIQLPTSSLAELQLSGQ